MGTTSVRRNLFHHNLSRRPASGPPANSATQGGSNGVSSLSSRILRSASSSEAAASSLTAGPIDNGEIVVKEKNGSYKLDVPSLPPVLGSEDGDEMEGVEEGGPGGGSGSAAVDSAGDAEISGREKESMFIGRVRFIGRYSETYSLLHLRDRGKPDGNDVPKSSKQANQQRTSW